MSTKLCLWLFREVFSSLPQMANNKESSKGVNYIHTIEYYWALNGNRPSTRSVHEQPWVCIMKWKKLCTQDSSHRTFWKRAECEAREWTGGFQGWEEEWQEEHRGFLGWWEDSVWLSSADAWCCESAEAAEWSALICSPWPFWVPLSVNSPLVTAKHSQRSKKVTQYHRAFVHVQCFMENQLSLQYGSINSKKAQTGNKKAVIFKQGGKHKWENYHK